MANNFLLSKEQLDRLFPFYINIDKDLKIKSFGEHLSKIMSFTTGTLITDVFEIKPENLLQDANLEALNGKNYQLVKQPEKAGQSPFVLQGDILYLADSEELLFLSAPNINFFKPTTSDEAETSNSNIRNLLQTVQDTKEGIPLEPLLKQNEIETKVATNNIKGMAITDARGAIEWVSKDFELSTGYLLKEVLGMRPRDVIYGKDSTYIPSSYVDEMVKKKKPFSFENIGHNRRGSTFWFRTTVQPIIDEHDNITGRYYTFEDITEYKLNEDAYRDSIDMWKFAINGSGDEVWAYDGETKTMKTSLKFREMIGLGDHEEISISEFYAKVHPEDLEHYNHDILPTLSADNPSYSFDCRIKHNDNKYRYYKIRGKIMEFENDGTPMLFFGTLTDINTEMEKDIELKKAASRMEALLKTINYGIILENEDRQLALISNGVYDIFPIPYSPEQLIGYDCTNLARDVEQLFTPETRFAERIDEILAEKKTVLDEILYMADGRILERDYLPVFVNDEYYGHLWKYKDITDRKTLEKELKTSEARLTSLMNNFKQSILFEDKDSVILFANNTFRNLLSANGFTKNLVGNKSVDLLDSFKYFFAEPESEIAHIQELVKNKIAVSNELLKDANGRTYTRQFIPIIADQEESGFMWVYDDITESIEASKKLFEQKEYYQKILDELPSDIVILTPDFRYKFANKAAVRNDEVREWIIGKTMYDYFNFRNVDADFVAAREKICNEVLESKNTRSTIDVYNNADGSLKYMLRVIAPFVNKQGEIDEIISYGIDISEQVKNEKKAELQEKRVRDLLNFTNDGIFTCDINFNINFYNPSFAKILGIENENKHTGINFSKLLNEHEEQLTRNMLDKLGSFDDIETRNFALLKGKSELFLEASFMKASENEPEQFIGKITDITERVNKEKNLNQIIEKERELNNSKSQFIRITSHELRTPLAIIQANVEILQMAKILPPEKAKQINDDVMLKRMAREVTHMTETLNQLLMISRIENGKIEYAPKLVNLNFYLGEIVKELYTPHSDGRTLQTFIPENGITAEIDPKLIRHAVVNLLNNAFKYSIGKESPQLYLRENAAQVIIDIKDFGIGVPDEDQPKLFTTFFRASNTGVIQGSGIGLTIVEYVVKMHGGAITFKTKANEGSLFTITLNKQQKQ